MTRYEWALRNAEMAQRILDGVDFKTNSSYNNLVGFQKGCFAMMEFIDDDLLDIVELAHAMELPRHQLAGFISALDMYLMGVRDELSTAMSEELARRE